MKDQSTGDLDARDLRIALVVSEYHGPITSGLQEGAAQTFLDAGGAGENLQLIHTAGTFELTAVCRALAIHGSIHGDVDAIVAIGCVITGETAHDQYICDSVVQGLTDITVRTGVPIAFGVLTCQTLEQARSRAGGRVGNKGVEAMAAAIRTTRTILSLREGSKLREGNSVAGETHVEAP